MKSRSKVVEIDIPYIQHKSENKEMLENTETQLALLTKSEFDWLRGEKRVSPAYERWLRFTVRRKMMIFLDKELPLIKQFLVEND